MDEHYFLIFHSIFHMARWHTLARDVRAFASSLEHDEAHGARANERREGDHVQDAVLVEHHSKEDELDRSP